jgi:CHAT domain-containing protein
VAGPKSPPLTAEQKEKLQERDGLIAQIEKLLGQGKLDEAARSIEKLIVLEKDIFGDVQEKLARLLDLLGAIREEQREFKAAREVRTQALQQYTKLYGGTDWRVTDARLALSHVDLLAQLTPEQTDWLRLATRFTSEAREHSSRRKYADAEQVDRRALKIRRDLLGEAHRDTAVSYNNLADDLRGQRQYAAAENLDRQALAIFIRLLGEQHPDTASSCFNLAADLHQQGKYAAAEQLDHRALAIRVKLLGEGQRDTAISYNNLAADLRQQGQYAAAEELDGQALAIFIKVFGEEHRDTATSYSTLAVDLYQQGQYAAAEKLHRQALTIRLKVLGEEHRDTATSYNNLAETLRQQGQYAAAEKLHRQALAINVRVLGGEHPETAILYSNLAADLSQQGQYAAAENLNRQALAIRLKVLGEEHPDTAMSYNNLAEALRQQGQYAAAEKLHRQALAINVKLLGEEHPKTATSYDNLAADLYQQGQYAAAEKLHRQALAISIKVLGEAHPDTATSYNNLAWSCYAQGEFGQAEEFAILAAKGFQAARLRVSFTGLGRTDFGAENSPLAFLAALLARNGKPGDAWKYLEQDLGRGLFDDLSSRSGRKLTPQQRQREQTLQGELARIDRELPEVLGDKKKDTARADKLRKDRDRLLLELLEFQAELEKTYGPAVGQVYELDKIQAHLAADAALIVWVDIAGRPDAKDPNGEHWGVVVRHKGAPVWVRLEAAHDGKWGEKDKLLPWNARQALRTPQDDPAPALYALYKQRLQPVEKHLQGVKHLIVLPSQAMAGITLEAVTDAYRISYAPSGTIYAWLQKKEDVPQKTPDLLALGDPAFATEQAQIASSNNDQPLAAWLRDKTQPLPGTRAEVEGIAQLFATRKGQVLKFLGPEANGHNLDLLAQKRELARFRYLHLATHAEADPIGGMNSFLKLTPQDVELASYEKLSAGHILRTWNLRADLVTLSACETALGEQRGGEGYVGFAQALFFAGARSLVLSEWKVHDYATTLLMHRFYENLLGARPGMRAPLPKGEALAEAKRWLKGLAQAEAVRRLKALGVPVSRAWISATGERPFEHPYFWAAFILIGDAGLD